MKEKDLDKDTIVAYHAYLQTRVHSELDGLGLGPGRFPCRMGILSIILSVASFITGILVITLRHRHVYLVDWWHAFVGPFFIILGLLLASLATYMIITAKRRSNEYRRELFFRPIGDYGVAVVHKSTLMHEQEHRSDLKSGTTPHRTVMPRAEAFSSHGRERKHRQAHENRGYMDNGHDDRGRRHDRDGRERRPHDGERRHRDDRDRDDRRRRDDRDRDDRRRHDDRERRRHPDDRRDDRDRRRRDDRERGEPEKRRPPPDEDRGEPEKRPLDVEFTSAPTKGGRRAVRGLPKIAVGDRVVLDEDFGKPAGYHQEDQGESEL